MNAFILIELLLGFMALLLVVAMVAVVYSEVRSLNKNRVPECVNGVPRKRIAQGVWICLFVLMIVGFAMIPVEMLIVNSTKFTAEGWLRLTNMMVTSCLVLLVAATLSVAFGIIRNFRKRKKYVRAS